MADGGGRRAEGGGRMASTTRETMWSETEEEGDEVVGDGSEEGADYFSSLAGGLNVAAVDRNWRLQGGKND